MEVRTQATSPLLPLTPRVFHLMLFLDGFFPKNSRYFCSASWHHQDGKNNSHAREKVAFRRIKIEKTPQQAIRYLVNCTWDVKGEHYIGGKNFTNVIALSEVKVVDDKKRFSFFGMPAFLFWGRLTLFSGFQCALQLMTFVNFRNIRGKFCARLIDIWLYTHFDTWGIFTEGIMTCQFCSIFC